MFMRLQSTMAGRGRDGNRVGDSEIRVAPMGGGLLGNRFARASAGFAWHCVRDLEQLVSAAFVEGDAPVGVAAGGGGSSQLTPQRVISGGVLPDALEFSVDHRLHFPGPPDRKSTRLNSSHLGISY